MHVDGDSIVIQIPMTFRKRGGRREIILPAYASDHTGSEPQEPLLVALARAHRWQEMLDSGECKSLSDLAAQLKLNRSYVRRILYLALLAPDIIEAIVTGGEPSGLSLEKLTKEMPEDWNRQRAKFGFISHD